MKLIILKNHLLEGLTVVEKSINENSNLFILKNVLIEAESSIKLITTNLELATTFNLIGKIIEKGKVCIPFNVFYGIIKNLTSERIELESKDKNLIIKTENYEVVLYGQNPEDFPIIPKIELKDIIIFNKNTFKEVLKRVIIACQFSEIRPELSGVYFNLKNNILKMVATDAFRLIEEILPFDSFQTKLKEIEFILPLKTSQELLKILEIEEAEEKEIQFIINKNQILIKTEKVEIVSRLIDGQFPDYEAVIPKEVKTEIEVNLKEIINAIKLTSLLTTKANDLTLKLKDHKKILEIISSETQLGENRYYLSVKFLKGEEFTIAFNWRFLLDGLKIYSSENIILGINDFESNYKASVIKSKENPNLIYILMPLRV